MGTMHPRSYSRVCVLDKTCFSKYMNRITSSWTVLCVLLVLTVTQCSPAQKASQEQVQCMCLQYGDDAMVCVNGTETCPLPTVEGKRVHCYAAWKNVSGQVKMESMGCWLDHYECYDRYACEETETHGGAEDVYFCCCEGDYCNRNHKYRPQESTSTQPPVNATPGTVPVPQSLLRSTILYSIVPILGIFIIVVSTFYMWRKHKGAHHQQLADSVDTLDRLVDSQDAPLLDTKLRPLQLEKLIARGRYACVWKARMGSESVAVKVFPLQDKNSFHAENEIYRLPLINQNADILHYIGAERRANSLSTELWLITEYHERGSLYDFLKGNTITWMELLRISSGMVRGLAYLHEAIHGKQRATYKPAIAHRDFKSKNVLLKADLTACVADFGLAMKFEPGCILGDDHGQVGTRRYMAPEVLEGAINFNRDAFLRIDMYACGLVLWELLTRCTTDTGLTDEYHMPFEEEAGLHPSLEDMQEVVISKKLRPVIRETWLNDESLASLCNTIDECWDQDPEARLSSGCVEERLAQLAHYNTTPLIIAQEAVPAEEEQNNRQLGQSSLPPPSSFIISSNQQPTTTSTSTPASLSPLSPSTVVTMDTSLSTAASTTVDTTSCSSSSSSSSGMTTGGGGSSGSGEENSGSSAGSTLPYLRTEGEMNAVYSPPNQLSSTRI